MLRHFVLSKQLSYVYSLTCTVLTVNVIIHEKIHFGYGLNKSKETVTIQQNGLNKSKETVTIQQNIPFG